MEMEQRYTIITLGVNDLQRSTEFFEKLSWRRSAKETPGISFFQCGSVAIALYPKSELAKDANVQLDDRGSGTFTIAYNTRTKGEVNTVLEEAKSAGAEIVKPAEEAFWGGYSGYFRDLDGHLWEIAWNPGFPLDDKGAVHLP
ncbi:MAG: VOC family protein, partial [Alphaproteobacteria bacterium]